MNNLIDEAKQQAISTGYDQVIFRTSTGKSIFEKITSAVNMHKNRIIGYIILTYEDSELKANFSKNKFLGENYQ